MKTLLLLFVSLSVFADLLPPIPRDAKPATLKIEITRTVDYPTLEIPSKLVGGGTQAMFGIAVADLLAGVFLASAGVFGGVWLMRRRQTAGLALIVASVCAGTMVANVPAPRRVNSGDLGDVRKMLNDLGKPVEGTVYVKVIPGGGDQVRLLLPIPREPRLPPPAR